MEALMKGGISLDSIQLENFRSLKNTGPQKLSPITILVGQNSSGKSSFLRAFPLLKQSISKRTSGPILWAGDIDDYVDFGSFEETVTHDGAKNISFGFSFTLSFDPNLRRYSSNLYPNIIWAINSDKSPINVKYHFSICSTNSHEFVSFLSIELNNTKFSFDLIHNTIQVDDYTIPIDSSDMISSDNRIIAENDWYQEITSTTAFSRCFEFRLPDISECYKKLLRYSTKSKKATVKFDQSLSINVSMAYIGYFLIQGKSISEIIKLANNSSNELSIDLLEYVPIICSHLTNKNTVSKEHIPELLKLYFFYGCFSIIDGYIFEYFKQVHYIAPIRATAERYYRLRNLSIDEIDYQGKNLAIFINSLSTTSLKKFQSWTNKYFGFSVGVSRSSGHLSLYIMLDGSNNRINISDSGFGYSQILPIITQLWELSSRSDSANSFKAPLIIAIEQPELHLHPAMQARLSKAFIASIDLAKQNGFNLQIIIETHSETIINYFGRAIAHKELTSDDVSVILFDKKPGEIITNVTNSFYDKYGFLNNWPIGFFAPED